MKEMFYFVVRHFQATCTHPERVAQDDLLNRELADTATVSWCMRCGAVRPQWANQRLADWRCPDATLPLDGGE